MERFYIVILEHPVLPRLGYFHSSSSGQNKFITSEDAKNPIVCQNVNSTCKSMPTSVVVALMKYRSRENNCAAINFDLTINFDFFDLMTLESLMLSA